VIYPFASEIVLALAAWVVFLVASQAEKSARRDVRAAIEERKSRAARCHAEGTLTGERWRCALMLLMAGLATYAVYAPPPPGPGHFWSPEQVTLGRVMFAAMIFGHGMWVRVDRRTRRRTLQVMLEDEM